MTAPFAADLCGFRTPGGLPSTSDSHDPGSVEWGRELFVQLGVPPDQPAIDSVGARLERLVIDDLRRARPDLDSQQSRRIRGFAQYRHLGAFEQFQSDYQGPAGLLDDALTALAEVTPSSDVTRASGLIRRARAQAARDHQIVQNLQASMPQESLLRLDVTVGNRATPPRMLVGLSCKWTLRTDRAQDCISQGNKLVALRRGPMPHYAALTMEPRPAMLKLLAYGSGAVDCVYHVALPELLAAGAALDARKRTKSSAEQRSSLERMFDQGRLRSYGELLDEVSSLPDQSAGR